MVKKIIAILGLLLIFTIIDIKLENNKKKLNFLELLNLDYDSYNLKENVVSIDIQGVYDDKLYLSLIDFTNNRVTAITKALIVYDFSKNEVNIIDPNLNKRITSYMYDKNYIYYTSIYYENEVLHWDLSVTEDNFLSSNVLKTGTIESAINFPIIFKENSNIYLFSIDDSLYKQNIYKLFLSELIEIMSLDSNIEMLYDLEKIKVLDNNVYYISDDNNGRELKKFDMAKNITTVLYKSNSDLETIFEFEVLPNDTVIINSIKNNISTIICLDKNAMIKKYHHNHLISYMEILDDHLIIMMDKNNDNLIYNTKTNKLESKNGMSKDFRFKFKVKDKNTIVFQKNNSKIYLYSYDV